MEIKGKTVLVTGGSQGLGEQLCRELAGAGMKVIVNCAHNAARARKIAEEIGGCAMVFDIADPDAVRNAFADIRELHVLINNARLDPYRRPPVMSDAEWFDRMIGVNLKGPYLCSLAAAEKMFIPGKSASVMPTARASMLVATAIRNIVFAENDSFDEFSSFEKDSNTMFPPIKTSRAKAIQWSKLTMYFSNIVPR